ncbi:Nif3-like dinuclear metal center hexameric protein [Arcobacter sp.]|uniref:Nif3-like dinuclear metal center hexameric protein n=1 Tax=unclassified Arcobacter TaxID=2593671 RepID=UPI003B009C96
MKIKEIYDYLDELSPFSLQEKWDNSGLVVGAFDEEINKVYISIDLDEELVSNMEENSLVITHHPLIFAPLKRVNFDSYSTKILRSLIQKNISLISMHTNIDKTHLNKYVGKEILGLNLENSEEYISYAKVNSSFDKFCEEISKKLNIEELKFVKCSDEVKRVALVTGAGMSMLSEVDADCFLTGDIKYHDAMDAKTRGISLIDIRHYESEQHFTELLYSLIEKYLKKNKLTAIMANSKNPFSFYNTRRNG